MFAVPEDVGARREAFDAADQFVPGLFVECARLELVGHVHGLQTPASGRLGFKTGEGFRKWTPAEQAELRAKLTAHLKKMAAELDRPQ